MVEAFGAPKWANKLRNEPVTTAVDAWTPEHWRTSWNFRRVEDYLRKIDGRAQLKKLAKRRLEVDHRLGKALVELVQFRTYLGLHKRLTQSRLSALMRFVAAVRRIGKGTGVRARRYRGDARRALMECMMSVPCWVMPTWRISETLPAQLGAFDLIIIDEASQSDAMAFPALMRAEKVLVVGDDRQVSPTPVGIEERRLLQLRHGFLKDQPFADMLMPGTSLYDLAQAVFPGDRLMLNEHFRCVEPIIRFSFQFYPEKILPVRIPKPSERIDPPLVDVYVPHGRRNAQKINEGEAVAIVDEIERLTSDPTYEQRSIGVVSMIGDRQAHHIQNLLIERIGEDRFLRHHITCGDSATFQGKERDVMFVSMVASPGNAQAQIALLYEQRFNVALSRARDRMYLYRSVKAEDLPNPRDLKARVLEHFRNPMPVSNKESSELVDLCESEFERDVFERLSALGYRVTPQVPVGEFRIDLVIEGEKDRRLAVELDGDRYHGPDRWLDDWNRQKILERVGWRFWRCWASSFVMDPDACMQDLVSTLEQMDISPIGVGSGRHPYTEYRTLDTDALIVSKTEGLEDEELEVVAEVGDRLTLAFTRDPRRHYVITLSKDNHDPLNGVLSIDDPAGRTLLGVVAEDEVELIWDGDKQRATVLTVEKADTPTGQGGVSEVPQAASRTPHVPDQIDVTAPSELSAGAQQDPIIQGGPETPADGVVTPQPEQIVGLGDAVTYCDRDNPDELVKVQIVDGPNDPQQGIISKNSPVGSALLDQSVNEEIEARLPHETRILVIKEIIKSKPDAPVQSSLFHLKPPSANERTTTTKVDVSGQDRDKLEYKNWARHPLPDPLTASRASVLEGLVDIIKTEGPMLALRAYQIYVRAAGIQRVGNIVRSKLNKALFAGTMRGTILAEDDHTKRGQIFSIVRLPQTPQVIVRSLGNRTFGEIPPSEIAEIMRRERKKES